MGDGSDQATCAPSGTGKKASPRPPPPNEVSGRGGNNDGGGDGSGGSGDGDGDGGASSIGGGSGGGGGRGGGAGIGASYHGATRDGDHASKRARGASPLVSRRNAADGGVGFGDARKQTSATREAQ